MAVVHVARLALPKGPCSGPNNDYHEQDFTLTRSSQCNEEATQHNTPPRTVFKSAVNNLINAPNSHGRKRSEQGRTTFFRVHKKIKFGLLNIFVFFVPVTLYLFLNTCPIQPFYKKPV